MRSIFILLFTIQTLVELSAQPRLTLLKNDKIITRFEEGEPIRFKKSGTNFFIRSYIQGIHPGYIIVADDTVYTYEIEKVDVRKKTLTSYKIAPIGKGLMVAGASLFVIDVFNVTVIQDNSYSADESVVRAGLILIGAGAFMQLVNNNYFKAGRKRKIATLNLGGTQY